MGKKVSGFLKSFCAVIAGLLVVLMPCFMFIYPIPCDNNIPVKVMFVLLAAILPAILIKKDRCVAAIIASIVIFLIFQSVYPGACVGTLK